MKDFVELIDAKNNSAVAVVFAVVVVLHVFLPAAVVVAGLMVIINTRSEGRELKQRGS